VKLMIVEFSKGQLEALPKEEQVFLVQLTHLLDELSILLKCVIYSSNEIGSEGEVERTGRRAQSLFFMRILAGKLNEGWDMLQKSYFGATLSKKYEKHLSEEAGKGIEYIKHYFSRNNLLFLIRNSWAFHYDRQKVEEEIDRIRENDVLTMILSEGRGNSLHAFSDNIVISSILNAINKSGLQQAMDTLYGEILKVGHSFQDFGYGCVDLSLRGVELNSKEVEVSNVPLIGEVRLPYFVERTRVANAERRSAGVGKRMAQCVKKLMQRARQTVVSRRPRDFES
jgi:hypothetical protein